MVSDPDVIQMGSERISTGFLWEVIGHRPQPLQRQSFPLACKVAFSVTSPAWTEWQDLNLPQIPSRGNSSSTSAEGRSLAIYQIPQLVSQFHSDA